MPQTAVQVPYTCARCLRAYSRQLGRSQYAKSRSRTLSSHSPLRSTKPASEKLANTKDTVPSETISSNDGSNAESVSRPERELGAMSRRLAEATEDAVLEGGRAGRRAVEEAGFSEELKARLLEKVQAQKFQAENSVAFAETNLSSSAGRGTRDIATALPWQGVESIEDAALRMLNDAHKPLKPGLRGRGVNPPPIDMRLRREPKRTSGQRLANARDKTSIYAIAKDSQMTDEERESMRQELKDRFTPGSRAMPNSITGLAALANERIEDAIARGQFKNIPRGKGIERDARADNPFIDTTEYIMNKMIQRQDIVPPWIEKQQELVKAANMFRARLRFDWKRHAARVIASRGGSLQDQVRSASRYAESERVHNPKRRSVEEIAVPTTLTSDPVMVKITQEAPDVANLVQPSPVVQITVETEAAEIPITNAVPVPITASESTPISEISADQPTPLPKEPLPIPFRDPDWEKAEMSYLRLAVTNLNNITRSYNLMSPSLARKPYFSLERELNSCYADVAPQIGQEIVERARRPEKDLVEKIGHKPGGILDRFGSDSVKVYDSKKPPYGFKEFWRDLFQAKEN